MISVKQSLKALLLGTAIVFAVPTLHPSPSQAAEEFRDLYCLFDVNQKFPCNAQFFRKWLKFYFPRTGRTSEKIFYRDIIHWNYSDASLIKRDYDLARRIGIIGLLFKKVEHMHVFTIVYEDNFGDRRVAIMDFDDKQYVQPMKALLSDVTEVNWQELK